MVYQRCLEQSPKVTKKLFPDNGGGTRINWFSSRVIPRIDGCKSLIFFSITQHLYYYFTRKDTASNC